MLSILVAFHLVLGQSGGAADPTAGLFDKGNLVAWCVVPFDAKKRTPPQRVAMLQAAGIKKLAWDWRDEHLARMDEEFGLLKLAGIELTAVWFPAALKGAGEQILQAAAKHGHKPQLWVSLGDPAPGKSQQEKVKAAAAVLAPIAIAGNKLGCKVALYNHGGWFGEPENQVEVIGALKQVTGVDAGVVYNLHHGHDHLARLPQMLKSIRPHLLCVNLNGMDMDGDKHGRKILQMGQGGRDSDCLRAIVQSGYRGPIGVLGHTEHDAELTLLDNLDGLAWLTKKMRGGQDPGPAPKTRTPVPARVEAKPAGAPGDGGWLAEGKAEYRNAPLTAEVRAKMGGTGEFRVLLACDTKNSPTHWELFTHPGKGTLSVFFPGRKPDHLHSEKVIADGGEHTVGLVLGETDAELWVDGARVAQAPVKGSGLKSLEGNFGIGRLVEGGLTTGGVVQWARIRAGKHQPYQGTGAPAADSLTTGLWSFSGSPKDGGYPDLSKGANPARRNVEAKPLGKPPIGFDPALQNKLLALSLQKGDAARGAALFSSPKQACLSCHKVGESGGKVGPDLTLLGTCQPPEAIVEAVLWPNRTVRPEFRAWQVATADGKVIQGYVEPGGGGKLRLRDATGLVVEIPEGEIEEKKEIGSLMPGGVIESLNDQERADLVRFLLDLGKDPNAAKRVAEHASFVHKAETFEYGREPLDPLANPLWKAFPNRERLYDFYAKEAKHFAAMVKRPQVVQAYPGLDMGKHGHWGNQNEDTWKSAEWGKADLGRVLAGVFRSPRPKVEGPWVPVVRELALMAFRSARGEPTNSAAFEAAAEETRRRRAEKVLKTPPGDLELIRGVCVRLGEQGEVSACFNPETFAWEAVWKGGFINLGNIRHGFMDGLKPAGALLPRQPKTGPLAEKVDPVTSRYLGYFRHGDRIIFHYLLNGVEHLDSAWAQNGEFVREAGPRASSPLDKYTRGGGKPRWPERLERGLIVGTGTPYAIDTFETPHKNPWNSPFFPGDIAHLPGGASLVCTMQGDVWRVDGVTRQAGSVTWRKVASGLHQALGMVVHEGVPYVLGRDQITRLVDLDGDGEYDQYANFSSAYKPSAGGHDFICGLERGPDGSFFLASSNQGVVRVSPDGKSAEVLATGFRNPDGIGLAPDGRLTVPCSEGEWTPSSMICEIKKDGFYGYTGPKGGKTPDLPLVYLPRGIDNSAGGQISVPDDRWGPVAGKMVHFSFGACTHHLLLRDEIDGQAQGALVPLAGEFRSGVHRGRFHPEDGQLYVAGMQGWGTYAVDDGCFQRVRYTGAAAQMPVEYKAHGNGVMLRFSLPVDRELLNRPESSIALAWNYRYGPAYGSPEFSTKHFGLKGHDVLPIRKVHVLGDGRTVFVEIPDLQPVNTLHLHLRVGKEKPVDLFATVHKMAPDFTLLNDYQPREKVTLPHPILADLALAGKTVPNRWRHPLPGSKALEVKAGPNLSYAPRELKAKASENLAITFTNPDVVPHNWVLVAPGTLPKVGDLANRLISDPDAAARHYVPETSDVIAHTDVVSPGEKFTIYIKAPSKGRYPFVCTFPGHWMVMNGVLVVE